MKRYEIKRYFEDGRPAKTIYKRVPFIFAKIWVKSPLAKGLTKDGVRFYEGYVRAPEKAEEPRA